MLVVESVSKYFGRRKILDNISLHVRRGELAVLLGPNGAGKTTLLNIVAGIINPDSGRIIIGSKLVFQKLNGSPIEVNVPPEHRNVGYVPQDYALFPHLNVYENIAFGLKRMKLGENEIKRRVKELMDIMEISGIEKEYPHQLSGGERQRVAIARALAPDPEVLLLDEPFSSIDPMFRERARVKLRSILRRIGVTTLMVTHDLNDAWILSDKIFVLINGRIAGKGTSDNMLSEIESEEAARFLGFNMLKGTVNTIGNGFMKILLSESTKAIVYVSNTNNRLRAGDKVFLLFRPDDVVIVSSKYSGIKINVFEAIVSSIQVTKCNIKLELRLRDINTVVKAEVGRGYLLEILDKIKPGNKVYIHIPPKALALSRIK
ncbi:ABC transporter ATP-binding protein [Desulfurococcaceae archaeon MEX13E-LK6-19]|nr:ABC transporter ATP-binding protein [Desulfurococcaceae archaeon MEX13E-LK6-19]